MYEMIMVSMICAAAGDDGARGDKECSGEKYSEHLGGEAQA